MPRTLAGLERTEDRRFLCELHGYTAIDAAGTKPPRPPQTGMARTAESRRGDLSIWPSGGGGRRRLQSRWPWARSLLRSRFESGLQRQPCEDRRSVSRRPGLPRRGILPDGRRQIEARLLWKPTQPVAKMFFELPVIPRTSPAAEARPTI